ncbi:MAG: hypothetical protein A3D65_06445 [Candidatus Lloydbacteria bacterium RIFCSPHIGHO2_02_FULL_50_13]|uniref:phenylalanine--tRNA ligase n=1 Tax=Candidatus Lloydbacteria bacterium RIFCSPHIGHO2_02_FULL_50_13 TaxID=1798661 RepID=A0A1G2D3X0_9BACT|nr:MAG: hypothetical protein A3D65_06445 [Candidatus Lloydbacteria bacterium RIFCSPHIGHO2_02_FULL_50_13]
MQDTFWIKPSPTDTERRLLRTHTSPVQIRYMETKMKAGIEPPYAIVVPGKVFRNEATDATHEAQFFQVEGLLVGKDVTLGMLKGVLGKFFSELFGGETAVRFRTSFFPFVEPGVEVDMQCFRCRGEAHFDIMPEGKLRERVKAKIEKDIKKTNRDLCIETTLGQGTIYTPCSVCRGSGWIEIMGAGMVHPKVLEAAGVDPKKHKGFAFGGGIDRIAMLKWGIDDVRLLYNGDLRVVNQF